MNDQAITQTVLVMQDAIKEDLATQRMAIFNDNGTPVEFTSTGPVTGADVLLTGLEEGSTTEVSDTDTVNEAIANLQAQVLENAPTAVTGADVLLTGLASGSAVAIGATDTVNVAMAKLQAQIDALTP